ncbi:semaphorin-1A-like isoform X2 [Branchiostoma floridae]|uniref:Semaphorin-1A-like isoform X2 n=1 Tax=Branchiostoma floridae TaxID=7739 RepID=A0A9J7MFX5_BRAFL|nr:semaphorin-1A-like isoform X2 [Branchiostoma floridae]
MYPTQLARRLSALTGALLVLLTNLSSLCGGFPEDLYPLHQIPYTEGSPEYEVFCGHRHNDEFSNCSHNYEFQLLRELAYDGRNHLLLGAKNHVFLVDVDDFQIFRSIEWKSTEDDQGMCQMKGLMKHECHNFIRVLELRNDSTLFVCGTNAYDPKCRDYPLEVFSERAYNGGAPTMSGIAKCPFDPSHKNTAVFADGKLYSATVADFTARDTVIYRSLGYSEPYDPTLKTEQYDSKWLNEPSFIKSFEHGNKVFFFFKETAVEYINCGKTIYSRVARVCKDDQGGQRVLQNRWTTYMKARLNCSVPGEYPFYFDEIQAMTDLIQVGDSYRMYAVFTTPQNSISGSAVCAFDMENITEAFDGKYKEQETTQSTWLPVPPNRVPSPRPGNCVNNSKLVPDTTLNFVKTHPLMDSAVGAWGGEPLFIKTGSARFTAIAVDTEAGIGNHLVMFIGTNTGKVLKILYVDGKQIFLEEIEVMDQDTPEGERSILNLRLVQKTPREKVLVAVTQRKVVQVPLARCQRYSSCRSCVKAQDPYCGWSGDNNDCREAVSNTLQDILNGDHTSFTGYTCSGFSDYGDTSPQSTQAPCECRSPVLEVVPLADEDEGGPQAVSDLAEQLLEGFDTASAVEQTKTAVSRMYGGNTNLEIVIRRHGEVFGETAQSLYQRLVLMCDSKKSSQMQTHQHMKQEWGCLRRCLLRHHRDVMTVGHLTSQERYDILDAMLSVVYDIAMETVFSLVSRRVSDNVTAERQTYGLLLDELLLDRYNHTCNSSRMYHRNRLEINILESFLVREDQQMLLNSSRLQLLRGIHRSASRFLQAEQNLAKYGERLVVKWAKLTKMMVRHDADLQVQYNRTVQPVVDIIQDLSPAEKERAKWHVFSNTVTKVVCRALLQLSGTECKEEETGKRRCMSEEVMEEIDTDDDEEEQEEGSGADAESGIVSWVISPGWKEWKKQQERMRRFILRSP